MEPNKTENLDEDQQLESLESPDIPSSSQPLNSPAAAEPTPEPLKNQATETEKNESKRKIFTAFRHKLARFNIYLLGFFLVLLIAALATYASYNASKKEEAKDDILITEPLSQEVLDQLRQTDVKVGDPKQILSIESNAIFSGKVLIRDDLEIAGQLKVGQPIEVPGLSVNGNSIFDQIQAKGMNIDGNSTINGQLAVNQGLNVNGNLSVSGNLSAGRITIQDLQIGGNLLLAKHIDAGGPTPSKTNGGALGGGGTASVSGTDTAGTVNINTGGGPGAGCFVTLHFSQGYNGTPHVVISPVGSSAASLKYYVNRSAGNFSICSASAPPAGNNFSFDYVVFN